MLFFIGPYFLVGCQEGRLREHPFVAHEKLASEGDPASQEYIGLAYLEGTIASQSFSKARTWFEACAEQGRARCQYELGSLHEQGLGGPISSSKAGNLYRLGALGGEPRAMLRIGQFHRRGQGVPKDLIRAYAWYRMAAETNHAPAKEFLEALESDVAESVVKRGTVLFEKWKVKGPQF